MAFLKTEIIVIQQKRSYSMNMGRGANSQYHENAYRFLLDSLEQTRRQPGRVSDLSGEELLACVRALAEERFGPLAALVFEKWGVRSGHDFAHMVFELAGRGILVRKDEDLLEHFQGSSSYRSIFEEEYLLAK
jgi:uncharacterized repeat protein (TIGR04138 family)